MGILHPKQFYLPNVRYESAENVRQADCLLVNSTLDEFRPFQVFQSNLSCFWIFQLLGIIGWKRRTYRLLLKIFRTCLRTLIRTLSEALWIVLAPALARQTFCFLRSATLIEIEWILSGSFPGVLEASCSLFKSEAGAEAVAHNTVDSFGLKRLVLAQSLLCYVWTSHYSCSSISLRSHTRPKIAPGTLPSGSLEHCESSSH